MAVRDQQSLGLNVWWATPGSMRTAHAHSDLELNLLLGGRLRYVMAGSVHDVLPGQLTVFWGSMPHQVTHAEPDSQGLWMTIPLSWFMLTDPPERLTEALLLGRMVQAVADAQQADLDRAALERWSADLNASNADVRHIVLLEVEARLRRMALQLDRTGEQANRIASLPKAEQMAAFIARHYAEPITVDHIADHVGLHPNYAMQLFRRVCGMSMGQYLMRLRISHAQRLLITTDRKVLDIALDAGFGSASRFYEAFADVVHQSPRSYRQQMRGN